MHNLKEAQAKPQLQLHLLHSGSHFQLGQLRLQPLVKEFTFPLTFQFGIRDEEREKALTCEKLQLCDLNVFWSIWDKAANSNEGWRSLHLSHKDSLLLLSARDT